jgi:hypothetical protein
MSSTNCGGSPIYNNQGTRIGQPNCTDCPDEFDCVNVVQAKCVSLTVPESCLSSIPDNMQEFAELMLDYICNRPATESLTWVDLTLNEGWTVPSGFQKPQYALDPSIIGKVHFRGICQNTNFTAKSDPILNSSPFTLPSLIRPLLQRELHSAAFRYPNITGYDVSDWLNCVVAILPTGVTVVGIRYKSTGLPTPVGNVRISLDGFSIETN